MERKSGAPTCPAPRMCARELAPARFWELEFQKERLTGCHVLSELLGILAVGETPNHLRIAGALGIPHSTALPMRGVGLPGGRYFT